MKNFTFKSVSTFCLTAAIAFSLYTAAPHAYAAAAANSASAIIAEGKTFIGTPYKYGAPEGRTDEFDCSSFIQHIFADHGIALPRSSKQQSQAGVAIDRSELKPGDLVFFYSPIHHVAVYIGNGKIMHTYGKPGVTIDDLNSGWWDEHYTSARRVLTANNNGDTSSSQTDSNPPASEQPAAQPTAQPDGNQPDATPQDNTDWSNLYDSTPQTSIPSDYASWLQNWYW